MPDLLADALGESLELGPYFTDVDRRFWQMRGPGFWKLERQQSFREPGYGSWDAFDSGDWEKALALLEAERGRLVDYHRRAAAAGFGTYRVRVVAEPLTPYLQWELHALKIRDECGGPIRILQADAITAYEDTGPLPEIYTLDTSVMYQAIYDETGTLASAVRYDAPDLVIACQAFIQSLYDAGEPIADYYQRAVASLPPPT